MSRTILSRKVVGCEPRTEGSGTTKLGTDPVSSTGQAGNCIRRHICSGKQAHDCNAQRIQKGIYVDTAGIE